ncbi:MAG TPA: inositol monophosphatase family protein [Gammaproteobacteria bacterium]|nr:inositol monophosphatase family protein [Gammaproteobacteria bacterium]
MDPLINIAVQAARQAGAIILRSMDRLDTLQVQTKRRNDFVTEIDLKAEQAIIETIRKAHPDHAILAEESGTHSGDSDVEWIIDPLDGTTNFVHGFPAFGVSIGIAEKGRLTHGVIYDPLREELYTGVRGRGALLNDRRIRVSSRPSLKNALIGTGFPFRETDDFDAYMGMFRAVTLRTAGVRRAGAASLDLAWTAAGRLDGFFELNLQPWDIAAGTLIIEEAGGLASEISGRNGWPIAGGNIVAGNLKVVAALVKALAPHLPERLSKP